MKKSIIVFLLISVLLCSCAKSGSAPAKEPTDILPQVMDTNEYLLYQNIFFNDMADDYVGLTVQKTGVFTSIYDAFNGRTRYYVWGYYDNTKCCDWQWELVIDDTSDLPAVGSLVEVKGTMRKSDEALDGYWIDGVSIKSKQEYIGNGCDIQMTTMSATLERVQIINMQQFPDVFEGKAVSLYGRIYTPTEIQHPYYDNAWLQQFTTTDDVPAIGSTAIVSGTFSRGIIRDCTVDSTSLY